MIIVNTSDIVERNSLDVEENVQCHEATIAKSIDEYDDIKISQETMMESLWCKSVTVIITFTYLKSKRF